LKQIVALASGAMPLAARPASCHTLAKAMRSGMPCTPIRMSGVSPRRAGWKLRSASRLHMRNAAAAIRSSRAPSPAQARESPLIGAISPQLTASGKEWRIVAKP
jgi:hypothetical protein